MLVENGAAVGVGFAEGNGSKAASPFQPQGKTAYATEKIKNFKHIPIFLANRPLPPPVSVAEPDDHPERREADSHADDDGGEVC